MNTKKALWLLLAIIILALVAVGISALGELDTSEINKKSDIPEESVNEFISITQANVIAKIGQPIEGFEPSMFLRTYPNLNESDFDGVEALLGVYVYENGELRFEISSEQPIHSAAQAISEEGMATFLENIATRLNHNIQTKTQVRSLIEKMEASSDADALREDLVVTISGEMTCLPHKDTEGPQTLECAIGIFANDGKYYGVLSTNQPFPPELTETGNKIEVTGKLLPPPPESRYNIEGLIEVTSVREIILSN